MCVLIGGREDFMLACNKKNKKGAAAELKRKKKREEAVNQMGQTRAEMPVLPDQWDFINHNNDADADNRARGRLIN